MSAASAGTGGVVVVLCTAPRAAAGGKPGADELAKRLVDERLCACVNVVAGVTSFFRWEGKVDRAEEALLIVKTTVAGEPSLRARLVELHPYDVPEVLVLGPAGGHQPYLDWVAGSVLGERQRGPGA